MQIADDAAPRSEQDRFEIQSCYAQRIPGMRRRRSLRDIRDASCNLLRNAWEPRLKIFMFLALTCLCACSWFQPRPKAPPAPPTLIVTGVPAGSIVFIDNVPQGAAAERNDKPQVLTVAVGEHIVEVRTGGAVLYREQTYAGSGDRRVIKVLSGSSRK